MKKFRSAFLLVFLLFVQLNFGATKNPEAPEESVDPEEDSGSLEETDITSNPKKQLQEVALLPKKFYPFLIPAYTSTIIGVPDTSFCLFVGETLRDVLAITNTRHTSDDAYFNLQFVDIKVNRNYENSLKFLEQIEKELPGAEKYFHVSKRGFVCDENFCRKYGDGQHSMGICSPYSCICTNSGGEGQKCFKDMVFDPIFQNCDFPIKVQLCGF